MQTEYYWFLEKIVKRLGHIKKIDVDRPRPPPENGPAPKFFLFFIFRQTPSKTLKRAKNERYLRDPPICLPKPVVLVDLKSGFTVYALS